MKGETVVGNVGDVLTVWVYCLELRCGMGNGLLLLLGYCVLFNFLVHHEQIFYMCRHVLRAFYRTHVFL